MPSPILVRHPVMRRHRPVRVRSDRFDFGPGATPVTLREVAERPREALRLGDTRILAAEGAAWRPLRHGKANVKPGEFADFLALDQDAKSESRGGTWAWARRSPLFYVAEHNRDLTGTLEASARGTDDRDTETAAADVRAFLDDRVRLYGDRVLVREETLLGIGEAYSARPWVVLGEEPRDMGTRRYSRDAFVSVRPDRLGALWELHDRKKKGDVPAGEWDCLATLPPELLRDDDAAWIANRTASMLLRNIRPYDRPNVVDTVRATRLVALIPSLEAAERRGWTHAIAGNEMLRALETVREAAELLAGLRMQEVAKRQDPTNDDMLRSWTFLGRYLDAEILPRAHGLSGPEHDVDDLMALAPGP